MTVKTLARTAQKPVGKKTAPPAKKPVARRTPAPVVRNTPAKPAGRAVKAVQETVKPKLGRPPHERSKAPYVPLEERREAADPRTRVGALTYKKLSELTGYGLGSEYFIAAAELVRGGTTKLEVNHRVTAMLPPETRNGTPKQVSNLISNVIRQLEQRGFTVSGSWKMAPPRG